MPVTMQVASCNHQAAIHGFVQPKIDFLAAVREALRPTAAHMCVLVRAHGQQHHRFEGVVEAPPKLGPPNLKGNDYNLIAVGHLLY
jgi:hypothetical protein